MPYSNREDLIRFRKEHYKKNRKEIIRKTKEWQNKNMEKHLKKCSRWWKSPKGKLNRLKRKGIIISDIQFQKSLEIINCEICKRETNLGYDHDHKTNLFRGMLCNYCNSRLAVVEDIEFMKKAREYLKKCQRIL